jgi:hypothetical protein
MFRRKLLNFPFNIYPFFYKANIQSMLVFVVLITLFISSLGFPRLVGATTNYARDEFGTVAYTNNNGSVNWAGNWTETNDDNAANAGNVQVNGGELLVSSRFVTNDADFESVQRPVNLSNTASASLSFFYRTTGLAAGDTLNVDVSDGAGNWTTLGTITNTTTTPGRLTYNIPANRRTSTSVIRFQITGGFTTNAKLVYFDQCLADCADLFYSGSGKPCFADITNYCSCCSQPNECLCFNFG